jgi:hypothetical protein
MSYIKIINYAEIPLSLGVAVIFGLSVFWNIKGWIKSKNIFYKRILVYMMLASGLLSFAYLYIFINSLMGDFSDTTLFGAVVIRPILLFLGFSSASISRFRYLAILNGGEEWTFLTQKN